MQPNAQDINLIIIFLFIEMFFRFYPLQIWFIQKLLIFIQEKDSQTKNCKK